MSFTSDEEILPSEGGNRATPAWLVTGSYGDPPHSPGPDGPTLAGEGTRSGGTTYFSFSISMESRFMSVSLKSKDRLSPMRLKLGISGGSGAGIGFMGYE